VSGLRGLLVHLSWTTVARYAAEAAFAIRGLVLAGFLGPQVFGVWVGMRLLLLAKEYLALGALDGLVQLAPLEDARGREAEARRLRASAAWLALGMGGVTALAVILVVLVADVDPTFRRPWLAFGGLVVASCAYELHQALLASERRFRLRAVTELCHAIVSTVAGLWAAHRIGLEGFLWTTALSHALACLWGWTRGSWPGLGFDLSAARRLMRVGLPILAAYGLVAVLWNVDRLLLWVGAGSATMGVYALQSQIVGALLLLPAVLEIVLLPHLRRLSAQHLSEQLLSPMLAPSVLAVTAATAPLLGVVAVTLDLPIRWWLPQYAEAIRPGQVSSVSAYFLVAATLPATVLIAAEQLRPLLVARVAAIGVAVLLVAAPASRGSLTLVAIGSALGLLVHAVLVIRVVVERYRVVPPSRLMLGLGAGFGCLALPVLLALGLVPSGAGGWQQDVVRAGVRAILVLVPTLLWAAWSIRRWRSVTWAEPRSRVV
jgi:O-antigen/teichoic acid export membrane protein